MDHDLTNGDEGHRSDISLKPGITFAIEKKLVFEIVWSSGTQKRGSTSETAQRRVKIRVYIDVTTPGTNNFKQFIG